MNNFKWCLSINAFAHTIKYWIQNWSFKCAYKIFQGRGTLYVYKLNTDLENNVNVD